MSRIRDRIRLSGRSHFVRSLFQADPVSRIPATPKLSVGSSYSEKTNRFGFATGLELALLIFAIDLTICFSVYGVQFHRNDGSFHLDSNSFHPGDWLRNWHYEFGRRFIGAVTLILFRFGILRTFLASATL